MGCATYQDPFACQTLANLCVLVLFNRDHPICNQYYTFQRNADAAANVPVLYFSLVNSNPVSFIDTFDTRQTFTLGKGTNANSNELNLYLISYHLNGTFLEVVPLTNELLICPNSVAASEALKSFGISFKTTYFFIIYQYNKSISCDLDLSLFTTADTVFYELYFQDSDGAMSDVPVKIIGQRDGKILLMSYFSYSR